MNHYEKWYAGCLLKAWKQYHKLHSHHMEIRAKIQDMQYAWGAFGDTNSFQLLAKKGLEPYSPLKNENRIILINALATNALEIIAFDTTLKLSMNLLPLFEKGIQRSNLECTEVVR